MDHNIDVAPGGLTQKLKYFGVFDLADLTRHAAFNELRKHNGETKI